jgi:predicted transglutaminase-like cysteine proteinase
MNRLKLLFQLGMFTWRGRLIAIAGLQFIDACKFLAKPSDEVKILAQQITGIGDAPARVKAIFDWVKANIAYETDWQQFHKPDYWQTPEQTLKHGAGDCEDMAILIYFLLRASGFGPDEVRVTCCSLITGGQHLFCQVYTDWNCLTRNNTGSGWVKVDPVQFDKLSFPNDGVKEVLIVWNENGIIS